MTKRNSTKDRRECFDTNKLVSDGGVFYLQCHVCKNTIQPVREAWEADHVTPHALGGEFVLPICIPCHKKKTKTDVTAIAKSKRVSDRHYGIKRSRSKLTKPEGMTYDWQQRRYVKQGDQ